ncbi:hypothetical protein ACFE04_003965 [Oxalis oulophora]
MSVVGFDFGNENCIVAVARQRGIDVVLNDESKRETPAIVCFGDKQRFIGTAGAATSMMNPKNSISQIKRLIGRQFSDPELQKDIKSLPFAVTEGPDGYPLIHAQYLGEVKTFTPTQILGMMFSDLKSIAEKNLNAAVVDCCIGIPVYFTDLQRRAVMDAATIAGLHPLQLIHETTATALAYGIYKTDLPETDQLNVAFVDIGHASMQVCIAGFKKGQLKILAHAFDRSLGGRDFDEVLFNHFAVKFKEEYKIDVYQNARACLRLRAACEKLKKVLSANPEAPLNIECLMDEKDVRGFMKRDDLEQIAVPILERVNETFPFSIALSWKGSAPDDHSGATDNQQSTIVFPKGNPIPSIKALTFYRSGTFTVDVQYAEAAELQIPAKISTYTIGPFQSTKGERSKLKVKVRLNLHGIVNIESAQLLEEEDVEVPVQKAHATKMDTDETPSEEPRSTETDVNMHENGESGDKAEQMETDPKVDAPKKKVKKTNVPVAELVYGGMLLADVQKAVEKEFEMALQDRVMEETKDKKNAVEAYVYDMRNKLNDKYHEFVTEQEREQLITKLQETEDWLYEDGEDETKGVYVAKLDELKKQGDPIEERYKEFSERGTVVDQLVHCVNSFREAAVLNECVEAEAWLREKKKQQDSLPKYSNPVLLSADVKKKAEALDRFCRPLMTKPRPAPAKPSPTETPPPQQQSADVETNGGGETAGEAMETDKPEGTA